jgi:hypothetical protein
VVILVLVNLRVKVKQYIVIPLIPMIRLVNLMIWSPRIFVLLDYLMKIVPINPLGEMNVPIRMVKNITIQMDLLCVLGIVPLWLLVLDGLVIMRVFPNNVTLMARRED